MTAFLIIVGALAVLGALGVILSPQPIYSALSLVFTIGMLAVIFLTLNAQFLFAVQLIVYAGAVMVLFVFIIALLSPTSEDRVSFNLKSVIAAVGVVAVTVTFVVMARNGITYDAHGFRGAVVGRVTDTSAPAYAQHAFDFDPQSVNAAPDPNNPNAPSSGNVQTVGGQLFTTFLLPFEITSLLLLVAAVGAVYLTRRSTTLA